MCTRREVLIGASGVGCALAIAGAASAANEHGVFVSAARRMRDDAIAGGDQPFGAVLVKDGAIVGYGPSRVIAERDDAAHAERVALRDAQQRLGSMDLSGTVLYSTSRPCLVCEQAAAAAGVARMLFGDEAIDAGAPRQR